MTTGGYGDLGPPPRRSVQAQDLAQLTVRANEAADKLREATRDGHELLRALQIERTRARQDVDKYIDTVMKSVRGTFDGAVKGHMEVFTNKMEKTRDEAIKRVFAQFDTITNILMGKGDPDNEELDEVARQYRATLEAVREVRTSEIPEMYRRKK
jgi:hypothetical protein